MDGRLAATFDFAGGFLKNATRSRKQALCIDSLVCK
jgi:hypothetical protein